MALNTETVRQLFSPLHGQLWHDKSIKQLCYNLTGKIDVLKFTLLYQKVPYTETVCDSPVISFITFTTY